MLIRDLFKMNINRIWNTW